MIASALTGRCPACSEGPVFSGWLTVRERCDHCGVVFLRDEGNWIGASVVAYMLGSVFAVGMILVMWQSGRLAERGSEWIISGSTVVFILLTFRIVKGFWVGLLHQWGYVFADPPPEPAPEGPRA